MVTSTPRKPNIVGFQEALDAMAALASEPRRILQLACEYYNRFIKGVNEPPARTLKGIAPGFVPTEQWKNPFPIAKQYATNMARIKSIDDIIIACNLRGAECITARFQDQEDEDLITATGANSAMDQLRANNKPMIALKRETKRLEMEDFLKRCRESEERDKASRIILDAKMADDEHDKVTDKTPIADLSAEDRRIRMMALGDSLYGRHWDRQDIYD